MDEAAFFFVLFDHDNGEFSVHGPMSDASVIRSRVHEATKRGRSAAGSEGFASFERASEMAKREYPGYQQVRFAL